MNYGGKFSSLVYNCLTKSFLANYPIEMVPGSGETKKNIGRFIVSCYENLEAPISPTSEKFREAQVKKEIQNRPKAQKEVKHLFPKNLKEGRGGEHLWFTTSNTIVFRIPFLGQCRLTSFKNW